MYLTFTSDEITVAKAYKYNGQDDSIFVKWFLRSFWDWALQFVPIWIAPNVITLLGFLFQIFSFILSLIFSDKLSEPLPWWVCIINGIFLFLYQTLDNLDGRQARRTHSSSVLGQFFDHGCDAITAALELFKLVATLNFGNTYRTFYLILLLGVGFFLATWQEYVVKKFYLGYINGPDEGLVVLAIIHILIGLVSPLRKLATHISVTVIFLLLFVYFLVCTLYDVTKHLIDHSGDLKNALLSFSPALITFLLSIFIAYFNTNVISTPYFVLSCGLIFEFCAQNLIVSHLVRRPPRALFSYPVITLWILLFLGFFFNNAQLYFLYLFIAVLLVMVVFDVAIVYGFSSGLGIPIFTLPTQVKPPSHNSDEPPLLPQEETPELFH